MGRGRGAKQEEAILTPQKKSSSRCSKVKRETASQKNTPQKSSPRSKAKVFMRSSSQVTVRTKITSKKRLRADVEKGALEGSWTCYNAKGQLIKCSVKDGVCTWNESRKIQNDNGKTVLNGWILNVLNKKRAEWSQNRHKLKWRRVVDASQAKESVDLASVRMALRVAAAKAKRLLAHARKREAKAAKKQILEKLAGLRERIVKHLPHGEEVVAIDRQKEQTNDHYYANHSVVRNDAYDQSVTSNDHYYANSQSVTDPTEFGTDATESGPDTVEAESSEDGKEDELDALKTPTKTAGAGANTNTPDAAGATSTNSPNDSMLLSNTASLTSSATAVGLVAKAVSQYNADTAVSELGLDCEMVAVEGPNSTVLDALVRVSIVSGTSGSRWLASSVVLDTWVNVDAKIVDFRTHVTGINAESFADKEKVSFATARDFVQILIREKIVVGHALINDFKALKLVHPVELIRDTSLCKSLRPHWNTLRLPSLKLLVHHWLGEEAQEGAHDSVEDATYALRLYQMHKDIWEKDLASHWQNEATKAAENVVTPKTCKLEKTETETSETDEYTEEEKKAILQCCELSRHVKAESQQQHMKLMSKLE